MKQSQRRLQLLAAFTLSGGKSPISRQQTWGDLIDQMKYYFILPSVLCHGPCPTCGSITEPIVHAFTDLGPVGYYGREKILRRMIDDGQLELHETSTGWQVLDTDTGRAYLEAALGRVETFTVSELIGKQQ